MVTEITRKTAWSWYCNYKIDWMSNHFYHPDQPSHKCSDSYLDLHTCSYVVQVYMVKAWLPVVVLERSLTALAIAGFSCCKL